MTNPSPQGGETPNLSVTTGDGKYTVVQERDGRLYALRYGEQWRDCVGDNLILGLAQDLARANKENEELKRRVGELEGERRAHCYDVELANKLSDERASRLRALLVEAKPWINQLKNVIQDEFDEITKDVSEDLEAIKDYSARLNAELGEGRTQ